MVHPFRTLLVSTDFSELGDAAVPAAFALARDHGASVVLAHVFEDLGIPSPLYAHYHARPSVEEVEAMRKDATERLEKLVPPGHDSVRREVRLGEGRPAEELCRLAEECGATLMVVSSHGRTGSRRLALGSVAERVARQAPCSVLLIRPAVR